MPEQNHVALCNLKAIESNESADTSFERLNPQIFNSQWWCHVDDADFKNCAIIIYYPKKGIYSTHKW